MSTERKAAITVKEEDIQWVEQAVPDEDGESALEYLKIFVCIETVVDEQRREKQGK